MNRNEPYKLIIIGSGPAGLTAGIYGARSNLKPILIEGPQPGGQLMGTSFVENWPGIVRIRGPQLMADMRNHAEQSGCTFITDTVIRVNFQRSPFEVITKEQKNLLGQSVIIATGATPRKLGCPGEQEYWGKGVSTCAVCDGLLYKDMPIVIVGGGDTAMEEALFMSGITQQITIVHIKEQLTASAVMQERVLKKPEISIIYNSTVSEIKGNNEKVTHVEITHQKTGEKTMIPAAAVFTAIGLSPNSLLFKKELALDTNGYIKVSETRTSVPGIFAAGDVADYRYRQAITSAGTGCIAAMNADNFLKSL